MIPTLHSFDRIEGMRKQTATRLLRRFFRCILTLSIGELAMLFAARLGHHMHTVLSSSLARFSACTLRSMPVTEECRWLYTTQSK